MSHLHRTGITRREWIQAGYTGLLGLSLSEALAGTAPTTPRGPRAKSVILVFLTGAPAHQDIWDIHMDAPVEYRGESRPRKTNVPGIEISEHLPYLARLANHYSIVRSMTHNTNTHEIGTHYVLTGVNDLPPGSTHMASRNDWPSLGSGVMYCRPGQGVLPTAVELPTYLHNGYGFSGQHGGLLGSRYDPWQITSDPNAAGFRVPDLMPHPGISGERLSARGQLLGRVDRQRRDLIEAGEGQQLSDAQDKALSTLTGTRARDAFDLSREPDAVRDRYGRHSFGQSLLLARRLVEAGVTVVQANMGSMNNWDTHTKIFSQLKDRLLPPFDRGFSALLEDLAQRGMLSETLVIAVGEFGRSPRVGQNVGGQAEFPDGRDHWGGVFSAVFAGGGVEGGRIVGKSDLEAAYPDGHGYSPADLAATVYTALGIDPHREVLDRVGRPMQLNRGEVIQGLF